ncbi:MAG: cellulase family glycosylhydrolase [Chloroflexi bacterium]|nr:cellulase family glycosylhydrolase [Chloroflexota bacterium]
MKALIAIVGLVIVVGLGAVVIGLGDDGERSLSPFLLTPEPDGSSDSTPPDSTTPEIPAANGEASPAAASEPASIVSNGPYLIASDALSGGANSSNQGRVFRAADGTIAAMYHRPALSGSGLQEIVMVHSHDGGQSWHGELVVGAEPPDATYSGAMDSDGNIHVAYGREAPLHEGGAIKLRALKFNPEESGWTLGDEHRIIWDWPDDGATSPILALTGNRLWLGYLLYSNNSYSFLIRHADPDLDGEYPSAQWSNPFVLIPSVDDLTLQASLVAHGNSLSLFFIEPYSSVVKWRELRDLGGDLEAWRAPKSVFQSHDEEQVLKFSVVSDANGNLHLVASGEGIFISYLTFDGSGWSRPVQLAVNNVYGPSLAADGGNVWTFWVKKQLNGFSQLQVRRWNDSSFWDRGAKAPWPNEFGMSNPSVLLYREASGGYMNISRYTATLVNSDSGSSLAGFFERAGDFIYVGEDQKFAVLPLGLTQAATDSSESFLEYWNGFEWTALDLAYGLNGSLLDVLNAPGQALRFAPPSDWQTTEVNGVERYYIRVYSDAGTALRIRPLLGLDTPLVSAARDNVIDVLASEAVSGGKERKLWYGAVSTESFGFEASADSHDHKLSGPSSIPQASARSSQPLPLPSGSPRQYVSVELETDEVYEYQLLDGQIRYVRVLNTDLAFRSSRGVTVWATATVEVSAPGAVPQSAQIPAAFFQAPITLNDVRIYVEITRDFNDFRLRNGGGTVKAARLMLSDGRYSLTALTQYRWPFPGMLWGIGPVNHYYQALGGTPDNHEHIGYFSQTMPSNTPLSAWHDGTIVPSARNGVWQIALSDTEDGRGTSWHQVSPLSELDPAMFGTEVKAGQALTNLANIDGAAEVFWGGGPASDPGGGSTFDWMPLLAEWYMAHSTPVIRSYVKDWLVLGPYETEETIDFGSIDSDQEEERDEDFVSPLDTPYLTNEESVNPEAGDLATEGLVWRRYDGILPGVVNVAEALSDYPNSGWARVNGNGARSVAYLTTYVYSPNDRQVVLNLGSSDPIKVWVGNTMVFERDTFVRVNRAGDWSVVPDSEKVQVRLRTGWNRVLIKLTQDRADYGGAQSPQNAWQLTFRVSDEAGKPLPEMIVSPEKDRSFNPTERFAVLQSTSGAGVELARPPQQRHGWPETADLRIGESYVFTRIDGSTRTLKLISYDIIIPRHLVTATVEVKGDDRTETHTLRVSPGGTPVAINGLRLYAYAWKEANDYGFEATPAGGFPLTPGKDVGFAVNDASYTLFPDMEDYAYPYDTAFNEGGKYQGFLEPAGATSNSRPAHAGVDIAAPDWANLIALHDGVVWYKIPEKAGDDSQGWLSTTTGGRFDDPRTWFWSHLNVTGATVPSGTFVKKGTVIFEGATATHMGTFENIFDFGVWPLLTELWNYEHEDDFPAPRHWLALGPYTGNVNSNIIHSDERGSLPESLQPREGASDRTNGQQWKLVDNHVNSMVLVGDITSAAPYSDYFDAARDNSVAYLATYIYSLEDHLDGSVMLTVGATGNSRVWVNGEVVFDSQTNRRTPVSTSSGRFMVTLFDDFDVQVKLKKGWNTLIVKTDQALSKNVTWLFSGRVSDLNGKRLPNIVFSARSINLRAASAADGSIDLNWTEPKHTSTFTDSYRLDVALDAGFTKLVVNDLDLGKVNSYKIRGLDGGQQYFIRVKPYNSTDLNGTVNWHYMDAVTATTSGSGQSQNVAALPAPRLQISSPAPGANIVGDSLTVRHSTSGQLGQIERVLFELDGEESTFDFGDASEHEFDGLTPGAHTLTGWLLDTAGRKMESTRVSVSFEVLEPSDPDGLPWLETNGNRIVDEFGNTVILRGVNIENREWVWDESKSIDFERSAIPVAAGAPPDGWGANVITLAIASGPVNRNDLIYLQNLDELVALAKSNDAYTFLVYRYVEPDAEQPRMPDQSAQDAMAKLAERYKNEPAVLYGLQVEPHDVTWGALKPRFTSMIDEIRAKNPRALIAVPGTEFGRTIRHALNDPIERPHLVYKTHPYDTWDTIQSQYQLSAVAARYPVLIGEFGPGAQMSFNDVLTLLEFAETQGISWIGWLFHEEGCPCMLSDAATFTPTDYGTLVANLLIEAAQARGE